MRIIMKLQNRYFLLRHGETVYQTEKPEFTYPRFDNSSVKLTKRGEEQIKEAARQLKKMGIDEIYSSDFFRTRQTSEIAARELGVKKINFDKRPRDINLGIYLGGTKRDFYKDFSEPRKRFSARPPKGESWDDVKKRTLDFLREIDKKHKGRKILIISHGDPLWLLEGAVKGLTNQELLDEIFVSPVRGPRPRRGSRLWRPASNGVRKNYIKVGELRKL